MRKNAGMAKQIKGRRLALAQVFAFICLFACLVGWSHSHFFIHSFQRCKMSCQSIKISVLYPYSTEATRLQLTAAQPRNLPGRIRNRHQVALEAAIPLNCGHFSTLHISAQQSVHYTHERSNITCSHKN